MSKRAIPSPFGHATVALGEHAHLRRSMELLEEACAGGTENAAELTRVRELVESFCTELTEHFAAEEADGYFGTLAVDCPELSASVARLELEHEEMRASIGQLRLLAPTAKDRREISGPVRALVTRVREHEHAENLLFQDSFLRDKGGEVGS